MSKTKNPGEALPSVLILGDQLNPNISSLAGKSPDNCRILMVENTSKIESKRWHNQRIHLVISAMMHFADELEKKGFKVDYIKSSTLKDGLEVHRKTYEVSEIIAMEPMNWDGLALLKKLGVNLVKNNQFLCHYEDFADWSAGRKKIRMEDFYRWQRTRLDILMNEDEPIGGKWNYDDENREPPPSDGRSWPEVTLFPLDDIDRGVIDRMPEGWGEPPKGLWPTTREQAQKRLREFIETALLSFGPHEDAMMKSEWKLSHSCLSSSLNLGLLHPQEVLKAAEDAFLNHENVPLNSVEGFIRQILGWREYVWGVYWLWMPKYRENNFLNAKRPLPPAFTENAKTQMSCVGSVISNIHENGYAHHIERLMVLGNLALTAGIDPHEMNEWMWANFVDAAEWVMLPNVVGMALFADGGLMSTKPYASGGAYINRMSDFCKTCKYDPKKRTGTDACPFTTLYWDFLHRNRKTLKTNHRLSRQLGGLNRLKDLESTRKRAKEVLTLLDNGEL
jgi:deoxyribodipyrimidine photolyase-related protein